MERADIQQWYDQNKTQYADLVNTLEGLIKTLLQENHIPYLSVNGRVKDKESYTEKFGRKSYSDPKEMMDIAGLRIITHTTEEVERACRMIEQEFRVDPKHSGDKLTGMDVDKVGYLSVHYIVKISPERVQLREYARFNGLCCEIQVRSLLQHAWAEIEHDRGYKFAGVLPKEIQRKFYLVAGTLELMDQEFRALSQEIDRYAASVKEKAAQGQLSDIAIDSTSLLQFLNEFFSGCHPEMPAEFFQLHSANIIDELSSFGIRTLQDLKDLLAPRTPEEWSKDSTYIGLLRDAMILRDPKTYFESAWKNHWSITPEDFKFWSRLGADIETIEKYVGSPMFEEEDDDFVPDAL